MTTSKITLGSFIIEYNTDTLVIMSPLNFSAVAKEAINHTSFGDNDDVFQLPANGEFDCVIFTGGDNYIGDYEATVANYEA